VDQLSNQVARLTDLLARVTPHGGEGRVNAPGASAADYDVGVDDLEGDLNHQHGIGADLPRRSLPRGRQPDLVENRSSMHRGGRSDRNDESDRGGASRGSGSARGGRSRFMGVKLDSLKVAKFDRTDFNLWRKSMTYYLSVAGLLDLVVGDDPRPYVAEDGMVFLGADRREIGDEDDIDDWEERNMSACSVIFNSLSRDQQHHIEDCEEAAQMWRILESIYLRKSQVNKSHLIQEFETHSMRRGVSMQVYITELKSLLSKLKGLGVEMPEEIKVIRLVRGLSEEYEVDRKILGNIEDLKFEEACGKLLSESLMRKSTIRREGPAMGNYAGGSKKTYTKRPASKRTSGSKTCYVCGEQGHISFNCPRKTEGKPGEKMYLCYICNSDKHKVAACPQRVSKGTMAPKVNVTSGQLKGDASS
jgi:hypothetical protein